MDAQDQAAAARAAPSAPPPSDAADAAPDHTGTLLTALGGFTAIAVNALLMLGVRRGLPGEPWLIALLIGYATLIVGCGAAIEILVAGALRRALAQVTALVAFLVLPIVFFAATQWLLASLVVVVAWIVITHARRATLCVQPALLVCLGAALCLVIALGLFSLAGFQHRELQSHFLMPEYGRLGLLHKDPLMFVSFAAEIMHGRWPGAALDGLRPLFYHFGTPLFLASFGLATGTSPFHAYMAGQQLLFIPLIVFYAGLATSSLAGCVGAPIRAGAIAVVLAVASVLAVPHLPWPIVYYSEASTASAPLAFMMLPLAAAWLASDPRRVRSVGHALCLVAASLTAALFKFSTAVTVGLWAGYLVLRSRLSQRASNVVAMITLVVALGLAVVLWPLLFGRAFVLDQGDRSDAVKVLEDAAWALSCLALAFVLQQACRAVGCELARARLLLRALLVMVPFAAAGAWLIGAVYHVYNSRYLFNNLLLLTLPLIAVNAAVLLNAATLALERRRPDLRAATLPAVGVLVVLTTALGLQAGRAAPSRAIASINTALRTLCERAVPDEACHGMPRAFRPIPADLVAAFAHGTGPRILAVLKQAPAGDAVFVPPANQAYWRFVLGGARPVEALNFIPAHFGVPLLLGVPPAAYGVDVASINAALLGRYDDSARARAVNDDELCRHARQRNVARVVVFASLEPPDARLLDCR